MTVTPSDDTLPSPDDGMRVAEGERERARKQLQSHFADDSLSLDGLEERLEAVENSETRAELRQTLRDLPSLEGHAPLFEAPSANVALQTIGATALEGAGERPTRLLAVLGGAKREGQWTVPANLHVAAFWGGAKLDFRNAHFTSSRVLIDARASMGSITLVVPDDVAVESAGSGLMGSFSNVHHQPKHPRAALVVQGFAFWAGVSVRILPAHPAK
ncbi:MAG: DUF1707 domain-containing protein [Deltaproteobacteria bacterium]|nr:DUF1707 domain-containing protein [Deltaproteobacteria bacterium]